MIRISRNRIIGITVIMAVLVITFLLLKSAPPQRPALPNPNGYDDLMKAGEMLIGTQPDPKNTSDEDLRGYLITNKTALQLVREGLTKQCAAPTEFSSDYLSKHMDGIMAVKSVACALIAEGELAFRENRFSDAVHRYLDAIKVGQNSTHNGVLVDMLLGVACERMGVESLRPKIAHLDASTCKQLVKSLEQMEETREPVSRIRDTERQFVRAIAGWQGQMLLWREVVWPKSPTRVSLQKYEQQILTTRQLIIQLAIRAYELEHGQRPTSFNQLVPDYLGSTNLQAVWDANKAANTTNAVGTLNTNDRK